MRWRHRGRRFMHRLVVAVGVLWVFALGSQASAAPTLSYQFRTPSNADDTVVIAADPSALDVDIRVLLGYRVSSSQPFANASPGQCTDALGDRMVFDCTPVPDSTEVTGSALADSISANCGGAGSAATLVVDSGQGNDDV